MDLFTSWSWLDERSSSTMFVRPANAWPSTWAKPHLDILTLCKLMSPRLENWRALKMGIEFPDMFKAVKKEKKKNFMHKWCEKWVWKKSFKRTNFWQVYLQLKFHQHWFLFFFIEFFRRNHFSFSNKWCNMGGNRIMIALSKYFLLCNNFNFEKLIPGNKFFFV